VFFLSKMGEEEEEEKRKTTKFKQENEHNGDVWKREQEEREREREREGKFRRLFSMVELGTTDIVMVQCTGLSHVCMVLTKGHCLLPVGHASAYQSSLPIEPSHHHN
jgi:hypothetical protein